jgi:hypothetical protein
MAIQRQFSLPNCTLVLEGLSNRAVLDASRALRPSLDILIRFECHLSGANPVLAGGRDLLDGLAKAANHASQQWLSGVKLAKGSQPEPSEGDVQIQLLEGDRFALRVPQALLLQPVPVDTLGAQLAPLDSDGLSQSSGTSLEFVNAELTLLQLFDLVEALDQVQADTQTLPDLSLPLTPFSRKAVVSSRPLAEQSAPVAIGAASLAAAAALFFVLPAPEVRRLEPQPNPQQTNLPRSSPIIPPDPPIPPGMR